MCNPTHSLLFSFKYLCIYSRLSNYYITVASCFHELRNLIYVLFFNLQGTVKSLLGGFLSILTQADSDFQGALKLLVLSNSFKVMLLLLKCRADTNDLLWRSAALWLLK